MTIEPARVSIPMTREWLKLAVDRLRAGGVVALPTETFYGLAVDPRSSEASLRVRRVKRHPADRSLLLLASDLEQVDAVACLAEATDAECLAEAFWPGPLTLVLKLRRALPACPLDTVAIRVPGLEFPRAVAGALGHPVTGTSANRAGKAPASTAAQVGAELGDQIDLILDAGATPGGAPSTLIEVLGGVPRLLRAGAIPFAEIEAVLGGRLKGR